MSAPSIALDRSTHVASTITALFLKALYALIGAADYLFLIALTAMLFCPPDLQTFPADRVTFVLLLAVTSLRLLLRCDRLTVSRASWPMLALLVLGLWGAISQPYDPKAWSVLAAQWIIPVAMFHLGGAIFNTPETQRKLQWFSIAVLLYLSVTAVFWLVGVKSLIFPRFILDDSIGIHFDRARGPFLQAVANGVCINVLAIVALHAFDRRTQAISDSPRSARGKPLATVLLLATPIALLATKTRAVWLAAVLSAVLIMLLARGRRSRIAVAAVFLVASIATSFVWLLQTTPGELSDRLRDRSPVEFRLDMYRAGWQMFTEKPLFGWGSDANIQPEVEKRLSDFHPEYYIFHNTYLQLAVQHGAIGLLLYIWLSVVFFRLGGRTKFISARRESPFGPDFALMWRVMLCVYLLNASVVVMNYQFVNGYMFTIAGILAAQQKAEKLEVNNEDRLPL
jgi:putative inorganic carbon (HCO3(-)) transporter